MTARGLSELAAKVDLFPARPGVYLFKDAKGEVLYVGKAADLRQRVRSYLRLGGDGRPMIRILEARATDVEFLVTDTEQEAFLLEDTLVKKFKPPYNIRLRDDKAFLMLRLDPNEEWPWFRLVRNRRRAQDNALYFGPYSSAKSVRRWLRFLYKIVPLRDCRDSVFLHRTRPCIKHQIGRCPAPCVALIPRDEYLRSIDKACRILRGEVDHIRDRLSREMLESAEKLDFERAQSIKENLDALSFVRERQKVSGAGVEDRDVFGLHRFGAEVTVVVLQFRDEKLDSSRQFRFRTDLPEEEVLASFVASFYGTDRYVPHEVLLPSVPNDREALETWLRSRRGARVDVQVPEKGTKARLVAMAAENARQHDLVAADKEERRRESLERLRDRLGFEGLPHRIHCFDISTIQGRATVASRVAFRDGEPDKADYRHFKIRGVEGQDDFASMREALSRSLRMCLVDEDCELPDLIVIDGGKGQLSSAQAVVEELGLTDEVLLVGLAKDRARGEGDHKSRTGERVFRVGERDPIPLPPGEPETLLMSRVRDEAHRFAITYHRKLRGKLVSDLDDIAGVGPSRRRALLRHFGSLTGVKAASREQIAAAPGMSARVAAQVWRHYHPEEPGQPSP